MQVCSSRDPGRRKDGSRAAGNTDEPTGIIISQALATPITSANRTPSPTSIISTSVTATRRLITQFRLIQSPPWLASPRNRPTRAVPGGFRLLAKRTIFARSGSTGLTLWDRMLTQQDGERGSGRKKPFNRPNCLLIYVNLVCQIEIKAFVFDQADRA